MYNVRGSYVAFENTTSAKEVEMQTMNGLEHVSHIQISWKDCFKLWFSFVIVEIPVFMIICAFCVQSY